MRARVGGFFLDFSLRCLCFAHTRSRRPTLVAARVPEETIGGILIVRIAHFEFVALQPNIFPLKQVQISAFFFSPEKLDSVVREDYNIAPFHGLGGFGAGKFAADIFIAA
eukprot:GEMP01052811.1.p3 GENE.GEMP01052811.1~~GEMP01052811.1.p3  ORF type:complete len:110 (-),score=23.45 GEMP01052811.1:394-723(-)